MSNDKHATANHHDSQLNVFYLLRIARNLKVKTVAEALDVTPAYINAIEKNEKYPSDRLLPKYADVLGVSLNTLLTFRPADDKKSMFFEKTLLKLLKLICNEENESSDS